MWDIKNILAGVFMIILDIIALRGILASGAAYYYAGLIVCLILTVSFFRNAKR